MANRWRVDDIKARPDPCPSLSFSPCLTPLPDPQWLFLERQFQLIKFSGICFAHEVTEGASFVQAAADLSQVSLRLYYTHKTNQQGKVVVYMDAENITMVTLMAGKRQKEQPMGFYTAL